MLFQFGTFDFPELDMPYTCLRIPASLRSLGPSKLYRHIQYAQARECHPGSGVRAASRVFSRRSVLRSWNECGFARRTGIGRRGEHRRIWRADFLSLFAPVSVSAALLPALLRERPPAGKKTASQKKGLLKAPAKKRVRKNRMIRPGRKTAACKDLRRL